MRVVTTSAYQEIMCSVFQGHWLWKTKVPLQAVLTDGHQVQPRPALRDTVLFCVQRFKPRVVTHGFERFHNGLEEGFVLGVRQQTRDILLFAAFTTPEQHHISITKILR